MLSGKKDSPTHLSLIDINKESLKIERTTEIKEIQFKSKDVGEAFDEKVFKVVDIGNKCTIVFCSHSIK